MDVGTAMSQVNALVLEKGLLAGSADKSAIKESTSGGNNAIQIRVLTSSTEGINSESAAATTVISKHILFGSVEVAASVQPTSSKTIKGDPNVVDIYSSKWAQVRLAAWFESSSDGVPTTDS